MTKPIFWIKRCKDDIWRIDSSFGISSSVVSRMGLIEESTEYKIRKSIINVLYGLGIKEVEIRLK